MKNIILEKEVVDAQELWAKYIIDIGKLYIEKKDYKSKTKSLLKNLYAYNITDVLFKPTLASKNQFRFSMDDALSYFIGGKFSEDKGFALRPWVNIRFGERKIIILNETAISMGNYFFQELKSLIEVKVEYTFGYIKDNNGKLLINVHHSSIPYKET